MGSILAHVVTDGDLKDIGQAVLAKRHDSSEYNLIRNGRESPESESLVTVPSITDKDAEEDKGQMIHAPEPDNYSPVEQTELTSSGSSTNNNSVPESTVPSLVESEKPIVKKQFESSSLTRTSNPEAKKPVTAPVIKQRSPRSVTGRGRPTSEDSKRKRNVSSKGKPTGPQARISSNDVTPSASTSFRAKTPQKKEEPKAERSEKRKAVQLTAQFRPSEGSELVKMTYDLNLETKEETFSSDAGQGGLIEFGLDLDKNGNPDPKLFPSSIPKLMNRFEGTVCLDEYTITMDRQQSQRFKVIGLNVHTDPPALILSPKKGVEVTRSPNKLEIRVDSEFGPEDAKWIRIEGEKASELKVIKPEKGKLLIQLS